MIPAPRGAVSCAGRHPLREPVFRATSRQSAAAADPARRRDRARRRRSSCTRRIPATRSAATSATRTRSTASGAFATPTAITISRWCAATWPRSPSTPRWKPGSSACSRRRPRGRTPSCCRPRRRRRAASSTTSAADDRHSRARSRGAAHAARRARRTHHEFDAAAARRRAAADRRPRDQKPARASSGLCARWRSLRHRTHHRRRSRRDPAHGHKDWSRSRWKRWEFEGAGKESGSARRVAASANSPNSAPATPYTAPLP